ncbi:MAG: RES family NAD+ phosphorylase, partial [Bryobacteraceae bacterium]
KKATYQSVFGLTSKLPLGATAEIAASATYEQSQSWARALWSHPGAPDGLSYRSRHDDSTLCIALFHRAADCLTTDTVQPLTQDLPRLARMLKRYNLALTR